MNVTILLEELIQHQVKLKVSEGKLLVQLPEGGIDAVLLEKLKQHKEAIRLLILDAQKPRVKRPVITKRSGERSREVLSHMQQRLWVLDQIEGSAHYNISNALVLEGNLDTTVFQRAFNTILERHEVLRTVYEQAENGQVYQVIQDVQPLAIVYDNLSGLSADVQQEKIRKIQQEDAKQPFDLRKDVLIRVRLVQQDAHAHVVLVTMHHIATDGWSIGLLIKEFCALYTAYSKGAANPLPDLPVQYADYAVWQQEWLKEEQLTALKSFWSEQLKELPPVHSLPLDFARPAVQTFRGDTFYTRIDTNLLQQLQRLCEQEGTTLFAGLYTVFTLLLARYSNENDIVIGTPVANREQPEVAALVGLFMNMIVLRTRVASNVSFIDLLRQNRQLLIDSYAHQQLPFDMLVGTLQQERNAGYSALFQVMMVLQNNEKAAVELPGVALRQMGQVKPFAMYDLSLIAEENRNGLSLGWEYNTDLFKVATIKGMAAHFELLLASLLAAPEGDAMQANMMSAEELQLLSTFNDTEQAYPAGKTILDLFKEQVATHPEKILVSYEDRSYTIAVLDEESDRLAAWLNVKKGDLVGIQLDRSEYMLLAILAVLKAGAGYVPIGMDYPEERVNYIKQDAQLVRLIDAKLLADFKEDVASVGTFDAPDPGTNAYAIYTSGSTGQPKGVINDHAGLYNRLLWMRDDLGIGPDAVIMQKTPYTFDVSVWELLMPLIAGCRLVFAAPEGHKDPRYIQELIAREQVSIIHFVPSMLGIFLEELDSDKCRSLRHVVCSGEALPSVMVEAFKAQLPWVRIHNLYGPTEAAIDVTSIDLTDVQGVSIGKPVANTKIHIVDKQLNLQPIGVAG
ncbi:condensation domain-containing protein, partial [Chitinophaga sp.]|uniref:non-ribosomal peptide synthetase n=1 Tax=Chitinophaga sp. TaxID=1869181 RepID=UPI0031D27D7A